MKSRNLCAVDLFCGVGGLSWGLKQAGISVVAGVDLDPACRYPFEQNISAPFFLKDVKDLRGEWIKSLFPKGSTTVLAGCAPCQPFSSLRRGEDTSKDAKWGLLNEFLRLATEAEPDLVSMENVPGLQSKQVFAEFVNGLENLGYDVKWRSVYCPTIGIPQHRRRLVLVGSKVGKAVLPAGKVAATNYKTVRDAIGKLPPLEAGEADKTDSLHRARSLTPINMERMRASRPGGTWLDWPARLRSNCHTKSTGATFKSVYARMSWDEPSPTITTQAYNFGTGRFGHPDQHRSLSLREAAILQTFPRQYKFVAPEDEVHFNVIGRLIGNAVPPKLGSAIGGALAESI